MRSYCAQYPVAHTNRSLPINATATRAQQKLPAVRRSLAGLPVHRAPGGLLIVPVLQPAADNIPFGLALSLQSQASAGLPGVGAEHDQADLYELQYVLEGQGKLRAKSGLLQSIAAGDSILAPIGQAWCQLDEKPAPKSDLAVLKLLVPGSLPHDVDSQQGLIDGASKVLGDWQSSPVVGSLLPAAITALLTLAELSTFQLPNQTNRLAIMFDPLDHEVPFTFGLEIFERSHKTKPHTHAVSHELFFILAGDGIGFCDDESFPELLESTTARLEQIKASWSGGSLTEAAEDRRDNPAWGVFASEAEALSQAVSRLQSAMQSTQPAQLTTTSSKAHTSTETNGRKRPEGGLTLLNVPKKHKSHHPGQPASTFPFADQQVLCNVETPTPGAAVTYASASPDLQTASTPLAIAALTAMGMAHGNNSRPEDREEEQGSGSSRQLSLQPYDSQNEDPSGPTPGIAYKGGKILRKCTCKKSRCLKLYCECFAAGVFCDNCLCTNCCNTVEAASLVVEAKQNIVKARPSAFDPKVINATQQHSKGCNCRKSRCLKKYCECFQAGVLCTEACRCLDCHNCGPTDGHTRPPPDTITMAAPAGPQAQAGRHQADTNSGRDSTAPGPLSNLVACSVPLNVSAPSHTPICYGVCANQEAASQGRASRGCANTNRLCSGLLELAEEAVSLAASESTSVQDDATSPPPFGHRAFARKAARQPFAALQLCTKQSEASPIAKAGSTLSSEKVAIMTSSSPLPAAAAKQLRSKRRKKSFLAPGKSEVVKQAAGGKTVYNVGLARTGSTTLSCNMPSRAAAAPLMGHWESPPIKGKRPLPQRLGAPEAGASMRSGRVSKLTQRFSQYKSRCSDVQGTSASPHMECDADLVDVVAALCDLGQ
ncbi:hypothetical protein WJX79_008848 [Trebouxia sp. C0005]